MSISEPFIRRPVGTTLLAIGLFVLGIVAYQFLPVAAIPRVDNPMISVSANLPGADPETVASSLATPLERRLGQISGVTELTSTSTLGSTSVTVQFDLSRKVDSAARDVQAAINAAASELPLTLPSPPTYRKVNPADAPIMVLSMTSAAHSPGKLFEFADEIIGQRLSQVEGVSQVMIGGGEKSAVRVRVNPAALASTGLGLEEIRSFLAQVNVSMPKGSVDGENASYTIYSNGQLFEAGLYRNLIVAQKNGTPIRLGAIADVLDGVENEQRAGWAGGAAWGAMNRSILLVIFKRPDANVIQTVERIRQVLPKTDLWLPPSVNLRVLSDRTYTIRESVADVQHSLYISIALVVMVIFLFLRRLWPTIIASVTVPLALTGTFAVMWLCGFSVDNLSLMAVTISVGFVVDDAIVVIENVFRFIEQGEPPFRAAVKGARQIGFTVVSMSISLVAVFIPLLFMGGLVGRLFHEFAVTLSAAILVSGIISLTLTPMMCAKFLRRDPPGYREGWIQRVSERVFNWLLDVYAGGLQWVLRHQSVMLVLTALTIAVTVWFYNIVPKGFFPQQDTGMMMAFTEAAQDISFDAMVKLHTRVAEMIGQDPAVAAVGSSIGGGFGSSSVNQGRMYVTLKPRKERDSIEQIIGRLRRQSASVPGMSLFITPMQDIRVGGRTTKAQYQYALQSSNLAELNTWTPRLVNELRGYPQLKDVNSDQQTRGLQANVVVDRDAAARLGVSPELIDQTLYDAFGQRQVSTLYGRYNQHKVILEVSPEYQQGPGALEKIYVRSNTGAQVPLSSVAKFKTGNAFLSVNHQGQFPSATLSFNLAPGVSLGEATEIINRAALDLQMPSSIRGSFQGTAQVFQSSLATMPLLIAAALIAVYIVLGMLYESLIHPITILSTLPSAGLGALLALMLTGDDLSMVSFIGIILLIGIVKKNAIMMIDFALEAEREEGLTPEQAVYKACIVRFRPIMMTTMAALLGALPLALGVGAGAELRKPLGVAVVGGLIVSQILTLYTTPVIYLAFEHLKIWLTRRKPIPPPEREPIAAVS